MIQHLTVDIQNLNIPTLVPMVIAIFGALTIICIDLLINKLSRSFYAMMTIIFLMIDLLSLVGFDGKTRGFFNLMLVDGISILSQIIILIGSILFILLSLSKKIFHEYRYPEYFALFLFMIAGFQFMVSSDNLILIFVGLETSSLALYTIIAMHNRSKSIEAAIKYFTMGSLSAAFFAFGSMIFYLLTGSVELNVINESLIASDFSSLGLIFTGVVFILSSFGFKLSLVPFHLWVPDVYDGSSSALAGFLSIIPKIAAFVVTLRFFEIFLAVEIQFVQIILYIIIVCTMTIPNIIALVQDDVKRMLAYSSISHAGFAMSAILIGTTQSTSALFFYWILFLFTNFGSFTMMWAYRSKQLNGLKSDFQFDKFAGLIKISPIVACIFGIFMLSLAGIPPFSMFWGKVYLISAAINEQYIVLAIIMAVNSAIALYYYLKLIVFMFLKDINNHTIQRMGNESLPIKIVISVSLLFVVASLFFIEPLLEVINYYVQISGY